jgi:UDP-glucose 4-epimerase
VSILVTGGAGYIGSHVVRLLTESGHSVVVVDNLQTGLNTRIQGIKTLELDLSNALAKEALIGLMKQESVTSVIHLAALKQVGESVSNPEKYFSVNLGGQANLLEAMRISGVKKLVFSSSAASYGNPEAELISEDSDTRPINPYGQTKLIGEWMAKNASKAWGLRQVSLRYFNVAGAGWPDLADTQKLNLIPIAFAAIRDLEKPKVFGTDYPTSDGSCVRDYVHVLDLARAHLAALDYLERDEREFDVFNVGTGVGNSVFEVLEQIRQTTGIDFEVAIEPRREGDPPKLVADVSRIKAELDWEAEYDLKQIIESAFLAN